MFPHNLDAKQRQSGRSQNVKGIGAGSTDGRKIFYIKSRTSIQLLHFCKDICLSSKKFDKW